MPELPRGIVTFLFTDIEGSTRLIEELGEESYVQALAEHRRLLRGAFAAYGGVEVDTQGDAFLYAFADPVEALAAATEGRLALVSGPVKVRIGLHTGEVHVTGEGYAGRELHRAARIAASGHGGQIVVSGATRELVAGDLVELGEHRLKDFVEPVALFQVGRERFPPLRTISNTNLPRPASSFVGRRRERDELVDLLRDGTRLVTLSGPGGTGKTRLALEAASELVPAFGAGVFWVGLATVRDPALVDEAIALTLGAKDGLAEHIGDRELLLLLDNFEQLVEAAPGLGELLERCPHLKLLVTSRELLRIRGEVEYPVPPLAEPEAVELFCARSQLEPDEAIVELCRRLDDLPLALELAAARTRVLSPARILERLSQRLDLLEGGRDADPRQRTLRATIAWSHDLLDDRDQEVFARLAVFRGGCTLEAAEQVARADLGTLQSLVEKSLLRYTSERFWMLETIREFARERLAGSVAEPALRRRHAEHFLELAERLARDLDADRLYPEVFDLLTVDQDNFRSALEWARDSREDEMLLRLVAALVGYWRVRGLFRESEGWTETALDASGRPSRARMTVLGHAARDALRNGDTPRASAHVAEWKSIAEDAQDERELFLALRFSAVMAAQQGDMDAARSQLETLRTRAAEIGDREAEGTAVINLGVITSRSGDAKAALELFGAAAALCREAGDATGVMTAVQDHGWTALALGDAKLAAASFREVIAAARPLEALPRIAECCEGLGAALVAQHEEARGAQLLGAAAALRDELGHALEQDEEPLHERAVADARTALGEHTFTAAWARGKAMTPAQMAAFAEPE